MSGAAWSLVNQANPLSALRQMPKSLHYGCRKLPILDHLDQKQLTWTTAFVIFHILIQNGPSGPSGPSDIHHGASGLNSKPPHTWSVTPASGMGRNGSHCIDSTWTTRTTASIHLETHDNPGPAGNAFGWTALGPTGPLRQKLINISNTAAIREELQRSGQIGMSIARLPDLGRFA